MPYSDLEIKYANFEQSAKTIEEETNFRNSGEIITAILKIINCMLQLTPALNLPPFLTFLAAQRRSGVLSDTITSEIISSLADEGVLNIGPLPDGSPNVTEKVIQTTVDKIIKGIVLNARVCAELPPGSITVMGPFGAMTNTLPACGLGIVT